MINTKIETTTDVWKLNTWGGGCVIWIDMIP
jgi:hypothetical protein